MPIAHCHTLCFLLAAGHESLSGDFHHCCLTPSLPHLTGAAALRNAVVSCAHLLIPPGRRYSSISLVSLVALLVRLFPSVSMSVNVAWAGLSSCLTRTSIRSLLIEKAREANLALRTIVCSLCGTVKWTIHGKQRRQTFSTNPCVHRIYQTKESQIFEDILISSLVKVKLTNVDGIKELKTKGKETLQ